METGKTKRKTNLEVKDLVEGLLAREKYRISFFLNHRPYQRCFFESKPWDTELGQATLSLCNSPGMTDGFDIRIVRYEPGRVDFWDECTLDVYLGLAEGSDHVIVPIVQVQEKRDRTLAPEGNQAGLVRRVDHLRLFGKNIEKYRFSPSYE